MSLVAYDSSDESEEEKCSKKIPTKEKKTKEGVKIRIPSLKEFEDEEDIPNAKKLKLQSGSGLFSLLPPPKNTANLSKPGFVPHILSAKKEQPLPNSKKSHNSKSAEIEPASSVLPVDKDSDDEKNTFEKDMSPVENNTSSDYFWLDDLASKNKSNESEKSITSSKSTNSFLQSQSSTSSNSMHELHQTEESKEFALQNQYHQPTETNIFYQGNLFEQSHSSLEQSYSGENSFANESVNEIHTKESLLNNKEFLKLQGRRRDLENFDIIDVNADDQLRDRNELLMKSLTEQSTHRPSRKKHDMPTQQQKRKHQITYLAFQAKERENDLKNQWASNSRTRRETQAKYGF